MRTNTAVTLGALLCLSLLIPALPAQGLVEKHFPGKKEAMVAEKWYSDLPGYFVSLIKVNKFPQVWVTDPKDAKRVFKIEIDDVHASGSKFHYFELVRDGTDANGQPLYKRGSRRDLWMEFSRLEGRHLVYTYPVKNNPKVEDVLAFAFWIAQGKEKDAKRVANRVMTVLWETKPDMKELIEAWIIEKEGWKAAPGQLELWNDWDSLYQVERNVLVTPEVRDTLLAEREKAAKAEFSSIVAARGNYDKRQRPPRKPAPTEQLILIEWRIKEFRRVYASSNFIKDKKIEDQLLALQDSIKDDQDLIKDIKKQAADLKEPGDATLKRKAEMLATAGSLDPEDLQLCSEIAAAWVAYANIAAHGNSCDRTEGAKNAIPYFEKIVKVYPENTSFLIWIGKCYQAQEDGKAKVYYDKVIAICGKDKGDGKTAAALKDNMDKKDQNRQKKN
ncbi:MAG TPA: hypothetical protein PLF37_02805 [Planctomycetota bacterium]|nr:hypothetical protein [Planctomycetota bacterium]